MSLPLQEAIIAFTDELVVNGQSRKEAKRPLSHLSPTLRAERKRRRLAVRATIAECIVGMVSHPKWPKHFSQSGEKHADEKERTEPKHIAVRG